jgi:short subunit dehydrogenase-like uncharacterized protein
MHMKSSSKFDIVVYGATGFTGQLVAEYLAANYKNDASLKWAMAGRSLDKLKSVRDAIGASADTPLIVADAGDPASLKAMLDQTGSVISTDRISWQPARPQAPTTSISAASRYGCAR